MTLTLVSGTMLSYYSFSFGFYYAVFCGICFYLLKSFRHGDDFYKTSKHDENTKDGAVHLAGTLITSGNEETNREDRFLENYSSTNLLKRRVFSWVISGSAVYLFHLLNQIPPMLSTVAPTFSFLFIVNATSLGQLLIALFINVIIVLISHTPGQNPVFYFAYVMLAFLTISFITYVKDDGFNKEPQTFFRQKKILSIGFCALLFSSFCIGFSYFLPNKLQDKIHAPSPISRHSSPKLDFLQTSRKELRNLQEEVKSLPESESKNAILGKIANNIASSSLLEEGIRQSQSGEKYDLADFMKNQDLLKQDYDQLMKQDFNKAIRNFPSLKLPEIMSVPDELSEVEQDNLQDQIKKNTFPESSAQNQAAVQKLRQTLSMDASQINRENVDKLLSEIKSVPKLTKTVHTGITRKEQQELLKLINEGRNKTDISPDQNNAIANIKNELVSKDLQQVDREQLRKELEKLKQIEIQASSKSKQPKPLEYKRSSEVFKKSSEVRKNLKEQKNGFEWNRIKKILPILLLTLVLWYLTNRLKKTGIETIETPEPKDLPELRKKWRLLRKMKLSPREEIIAHYNLFHECMQKIHYSDHEAPPSCIIDKDLMEITPKLSKSSHALTEIYAQCFYGNKNVHDKALVIFRKAMKNVLKVYQI